MKSGIHITDISMCFYVLSMIPISDEDNIWSLSSYPGYDIEPEWCNETDVSHWITEFLFWGFVSAARLTCFLHLSSCNSISSHQPFTSGALLALWSRIQKLHKQVMRNPEPLHSIPIGNWEETTLIVGPPAIFTAWPSNFNAAVSILLMLCHIYLYWSLWMRLERQRYSNSKPVSWKLHQYTTKLQTRLSFRLM